jgi:glycosyltransferase involved in cell wall biosynthesis
MRAGLEVRRAIAARRVALVHANNTLAGIVAALATRPGRLPMVFHHRLARPLRGPGRLAVEGATRIICVSQTARASLGGPEEKMRIIYDGVDLEAFDHARSEWSDPDGAPRIVMLGRLSPEKGQDLLLEAARHVLAEFPEVRFIVAGEAFLPGDQAFEARLRASARTPPLHDRVDFIGFHADVPRLLAGATLVCIPSRREALGNAALEAMAASKAVVGAAVGGLRESVVPEETGILVTSPDGVRLADAIMELLRDPDRRRRMGEAGRRRVQEHFSHDIMVRDVTGLYHELTGA